MKIIPLSDAETDIIYKVSEIDSNCAIKNRLFDLGITPNCDIVKLFCAPFGDPAAYLVRGALVAIRKHDARLITVTTNE